jgi:riboflavin synthase alpha subunit
VKLPGPSYYRIKFHQELTIMLFHLVSFNSNLIRQMVTNTYTKKKKAGTMVNDDFSSNMGRFIIARL